jgi:hypothetical protein
MALSRLIYASRSKSNFSPEALTQLVRLSSQRNAAAGVTGTLICCDGLFLQWLEGPERTVRATFERISRDPRHADIQELSCRPCIARTFGEWGMSCLHEQSIAQPERTQINSIAERLDRVTCIDELGERACVLLKDLKSAIGRQSGDMAVLPHAA